MCEQWDQSTIGDREANGGDHLKAYDKAKKTVGSNE